VRRGSDRIPPRLHGVGHIRRMDHDLEALKNLDFDTVQPGHGVPFHGKSLITAYQGYLKDLMSQVANLCNQGLTAEETAQRVDLTSHQADFPQFRNPVRTREAFAGSRSGWMSAPSSNDPPATDAIRTRV
jgi:hypothetical protein